MSTPEAPVPPPGAGHSPPPPAFDEIRVYSHSPLFYWWPVWAFGFIFSLVTLADNERMAIVHGESIIVKEKVGDKILTNIYGVPDGDPMAKVTNEATAQEKQRVLESNPEYKAVADRPGAEVDMVRPRVSSRSWLGPAYLIVLLLVIIITNIPLRGLWSLVVLIGLVVVALVISLAGWWADILNAFVGLHVFINLAGYLLPSAVLFLVWMASVFIFDRRSYIIFTPGQIRVCEEIGSRERTYDTTGMTIEKQRDDWFRHIFLGFGTGDLIVRTAGADRHEILMPNVAMIGFKIDPIQQLIRQRQFESMPPHTA
jgi:hypothetical protein